MKKIDKGEEPVELSTWKRKNRQKTRYRDLTHVERQAINLACLKEQSGLCAYCCDCIDPSNSTNEHVAARSKFPKEQLNFANIVASCTTTGQCDDAHKSQELPLTPLMDECETELKFYLSGNVKGVTKRAEQSIDVLQLQSKALRLKRKTLVEQLIWTENENPKAFHLLDQELKHILIESLLLPDKNNRLKPFSPVLVNILRTL